MSEKTAADPTGMPMARGDFMSTLNVDNMIEKLLNFKNTGKQVQAITQLKMCCRKYLQLLLRAFESLPY